MAEHLTAERSHAAEPHIPHHTEHTTGTGTPVEQAPLEALFDAEERAQFDRDDSAAGSHIGKMLALFFLYTVIVMSIVAWWTINAVQD